ncbi:Nicotinamide N-methyltransferase-like protein [Kalmanozyma brasiliensis GHG001]|uniref:FAM86 N-terminal domain-containing protein n=1 Tax=Kalmanozyma brasiliensis (strain GHG001) TaxID=1365824 RepID=V5EKX1_KALBG|nr:Nicotinamide N-methyltransferase-like protein [Kalmanozyma brasiliensis GHG001]EST05605.1 Nicotinamide N-methyltransferase-like protein [Kalmanozyma brasiliensis GHG001]
MSQSQHAFDGQAGAGGPGPATLRHARRTILVQYEARLPPRSSAFVWPSNAILLRIQDKLDHDLFQNPKHEATARYKTAFLRELCARLEAAVQQECEALHSQGVDEIEHPEVDAAVLERYVEIMASGSSSTGSVTAHSAPDTEFTTHYWSKSTSAGTIDDDSVAGEADLLEDYHKVTIREEGSAISKGTTGLRTWEAGLRLAGHLIGDPSIITKPGTRIVELGSGAGFVGTVCATEQAASSHGESQTFMTDMPGQVVTRLRDTLQVNGMTTSAVVKIQELDWLELSAERQQNQQRDDLPTISFVAEAKPTLVLAADVVYDPDLVDPLVETIRACLEAGTIDCRALVASTIRNAETYGRFKAALTSFGMKASVVELQRPILTASDPMGGPDLCALSVFPSAHDPSLNGKVELLCITLG